VLKNNSWRSNKDNKKIEHFVVYRWWLVILILEARTSFLTSHDMFTDNDK